jgi:hypothetical protein
MQNDYSELIFKIDNTLLILKGCEKITTDMLKREQNRVSMEIVLFDIIYLQRQVLMILLIMVIE